MVVQAMLILLAADAAVTPLTARPIPDLLVSLVELSRAEEGGALRVVLTLGNGAKVFGEVTDLAGTGDGAALVLLESETVLHLVDPREVVAVSLQSATPAQLAALARPGRVVSKVDVQRRAEELARLSTELLGGSPVKFEIAWKTSGAPGIAESGAGLAVVLAALEEAAAGLRDAAGGSESARRDLSRRLKRIRFSDAPRAGASFTGDMLSIGVATAAGPAGRASAWEIRRALTQP